MRRTLIIPAIILTVCTSMATIGCNDDLKAKDAHIAVIEDANRNLTSELLAARRDNDGLMTERDELKGQAMAFQGQVDDLRRQLNAKPEPETVPEGWQAVPGGAMIAVPGSVLFASGKADLRAEGSKSLDAITSTIKSEYPDKDIMVFGHTDDVPIKKSGWKDNYELSAQRALTVVRYLGERGLDFGKLIACGAGEHRPRMPNTNADNRSKNRRVEIFAVEPLD